VGLDSQVLVFTLGISLFAGILFGLAPALKAFQPNLQETLREGGRGSSGARHRLQGIFVVAETALALVLLVGASLMIRSLVSLWSVDPGFNPHQLMSFSIAYPPEMMKAVPDVLRNRSLELDAALKAIPGVETVSALGGSLPMQGDSELPFWLEGQPMPTSDSEMNWALFYLVEPGYLDAMQTPLRRGRFLNAQDTLHSPPVIVIDENFAQKFFPGQNPIGKRVNLGLLGVMAEIVGVTGHVKHFGLDSDAKATIQSQFYFPLMQVPDKFMPLLSKGAEFVMRTRVSPESLLGSIRRTVGQLSNQQVVYGVETMDETIARSLAARRFANGSARRLRRASARALVRRHLRRDFVSGRPTNARDWHSHLAWCAACQRVAPGNRRRCPNGVNWCRTGHGRCSRADTPHVQSTLRCQRA